MAGSYNHIVKNDGNLGDNEWVNGMLENGGDVYEAIEELYGMIWYLAFGHVERLGRDLPADAPRAQEVATKMLVEVARNNYKEGLRISQEVHQQYPDQRRDY